jgi:hypothetical protein
MVLKYYEKLSEKYRKMIPLRMVYGPIPGGRSHDVLHFFVSSVSTITQYFYTTFGNPSI